MQKCNRRLITDQPSPCPSLSPPFQPAKSYGPRQARRLPSSSRFLNCFFVAPWSCFSLSRKACASLLLHRALLGTVPSQPSNIQPPEGAGLYISTPVLILVKEVANRSAGKKRDIVSPDLCKHMSLHEQHKSRTTCRKPFLCTVLYSPYKVASRPARRCMPHSTNPLPMLVLANMMQLSKTLAGAQIRAPAAALDRGRRAGGWAGSVSLCGYILLLALHFVLSVCLSANRRLSTNFAAAPVCCIRSLSEYFVVGPPVCPEPHHRAAPTLARLSSSVVSSSRLSPALFSACCPLRIGYYNVVIDECCITCAFALWLYFVASTKYRHGLAKFRVSREW